MIGKKLGPYEIVALVGAGGMGEVYRAGDTRLGRDVALKIVKEPGPRFEQEVRAASALNHPNIVAVFDVGADYVVMELVDGQPLRAVLDEGPLPLRKLVE